MRQRKIVKLGGSVWDTLHPDYFKEWKAWLDAGHELVLIHGGGPALSAYCASQQIEPVFQDGRRVTTADVLTGAERVLAGEMQTAIVAALGRHHIQAVGLSGVDGADVDRKAIGRARSGRRSRPGRDGFVRAVARESLRARRDVTLTRTGRHIEL